MPVEVRVPALGESVVEATVGAWLKREGERVEAGDTLVQLETEKVNLEVAAETAGGVGGHCRASRAAGGRRRAAACLASRAAHRRGARARPDAGGRHRYRRARDPR